MKKMKKSLLLIFDACFFLFLGYLHLIGEGYLLTVALEWDANISGFDKTR